MTEFMLIQTVSHATHVIVDSVPPSAVEPWFKQDRFWIGAGAVASALVAIASGVVAGFTYFLGKQTKKVAEETQKLATATITVAEETQNLAAATNTVAAETQRLANATARSVAIAEQALEPRIAIEYRDYFLPPSMELRKGVYVRNAGHGTANSVHVESTNAGVGDLRMAPTPVPTTFTAGQEALVLFKHPQSMADITPITVTYQDVFGNRFESRSDGPSIVPGSGYTFRRLGAGG